MSARSTLQLLSLAVRDPRAFRDEAPIRAQVFLERLARPPAYRPVSLDVALGAASRELDADLRELAAESSAEEIEADVRRAIAALGSEAPLPLVHNADFGLARLCYALCRALRPAVVVETGVAYGVSSAFLCRALEANGEGVLHSIDDFAAGTSGESFVGYFVPQSSRRDWQLHRGSSRQVLDSVLEQVPPVGLFLHDSRHTWLNMRRELRAVTPRLAPTAAVLADDIERNSAFAEWANGAKPSYWAAIDEADKPSWCGIAVCRS